MFFIKHRYKAVRAFDQIQVLQTIMKINVFGWAACCSTLMNE